MTEKGHKISSTRDLQLQRSAVPGTDIEQIQAGRQDNHQESSEDLEEFLARTAQPFTPLHKLIATLRDVLGLLKQATAALETLHATDSEATVQCFDKVVVDA